ncbi:MAG: hypothetical protein FJX35_04670 [Alphaproteobacteria bacterium]|nr:hypothetical protein [Alphaproteobacteria bacterium]
MLYENWLLAEGAMFTLINSLLDSAVRSTISLPVVRSAIGVGASSIEDEDFVEQLEEVRRLKKFLVSQKIRFADSDIKNIDLGPLNNLKYHRYGRSPEQSEWQLLDEKMSVLATYLDDDLRRKIRIWELGRYFGGMPLGFLICAIVAVGIGFFFPAPFTTPADKLSLLEKSPLFISVVLWSIALGGLGACAFLTTTLLGSSKSQSGTTKSEAVAGVEDVDITDTSLVNARLVVGILFAFILGFPFSSASLRFVLDKMFEGYLHMEFKSTDLAMMIIPFLMGFSTSIVLLILERIVTSVKSLFGISGAK